MVREQTRLVGGPVPPEQLSVVGLQHASNSIQINAAEISEAVPLLERVGEATSKSAGGAAAHRRCSDVMASEGRGTTSACEPTAASDRPSDR